MGIKKKDFIEIEYTGRLKENSIVFDTTDEKTSKDNGIYNENASFGPAVICIGENQILAGIDNELEGKEAGKSYKIELTAEKAFGKKDAKLLKLVPMSVFKRENIFPMPGLQLNIDGLLGTVRTVSGGRIIVDFNHPLAGKDVVYDIKINRIIGEEKEKISSYMKSLLGIKDIDVSIENDTAKIKLKEELPKEIKEHLEKKITELTAVKKVDFIREKKEESKKDANIVEKKP